MAMTQLFHTIPTSCAILPPLIQICFVFVVCRRRVVEGSGVGGSGCVVYFDVHGEWVMVKKTSELWWCNDTLYLGCSYHLHSSHSFLSTWGLVMLKKKPKKKTQQTNKKWTSCFPRSHGIGTIFESFQSAGTWLCAMETLKSAETDGAMSSAN